MFISSQKKARNMTRLLSVDWTYFFPNFSDFNWIEFKEKTLIQELIWPIRYSSKMINRNILARDYYNPVWFYKSFWDFVLKLSEPRMVFIFDQQENISSILDMIDDLTIYHFDHNRSTSDNSWQITYQNRIRRFKHFVPKWNTKDFQIKGKLLGDFRIDFPKFDIVFVSRSSTLTSSWNDDKWISFIKKLREKLNDDCYIYQEQITKTKREFDYRFAMQWLSEQAIYLEKQRIRKINGYDDFR